MIERPAEEPLTRRKLYEMLADRFIRQIRDRRLRPGDPLPSEGELMHAYQVGRSSVREALRVLESKGLIRALGRGGFAVAEYGNPLNHSLKLLLRLQEVNLAELFEVRKSLEAEAAGLAAARRTEEDLRRMASAVEEMAEGLSSQELYIDADLRFHLAVAAATQNRVLVHMMHAIRDQLHRALASIYHIPGSPQKSIEQHRAILAAVRAGRPDEARQRMLDHLLRVAEDVRQVLHAGEPGAAAVPPSAD